MPTPLDPFGFFDAWAKLMETSTRLMQTSSLSSFSDEALLATYAQACKVQSPDTVTLPIRTEILKRMQKKKK